MANILDYIDWRGDLPFSVSPFNEVDNLLLSQMSYVPFDGVLAAAGSVTIAEAARRFFTLHTEEEVHKTVSFTKDAAFVLKKAGESVRFRDLPLTHYVNHIDLSTDEQFSALCVSLPDGTVFVAYRGTDDTIVGWKEDFNMSFLSPVPSQLAAVDYLQCVAADFTGALLLGGHSKGGNLAVYAAIHTDAAIKQRIQIVYNNDGPGFDAATVASEAYCAMMPRIRTIVPQSSIIGMLLEHEEEYTVVKSSNTGLLQHDAMSWQVIGAHFDTAETLSGGAKLLDASLHAWLQKMTREQREVFVDTLFGVLDATNAKTLGDLSGNAWQSLSGAASALTHMNADDRTCFTKTLGMLFRESGHIVKQQLTVPHSEA